MKKQDYLFHLIKSLSKSEKRYFKVFTSLNGSENVYLRLFEFIDKSENYDEVKLKSHFKDQAFTNQLHVTKNYLTSLILKSLRNFNTGL